MIMLCVHVSEVYACAMFPALWSWTKRRLRIATCIRTEVANLDALTTHIKNLEFCARFAPPMENASLSTRIATLRAYARRLQRDGRPVAGGLIALQVEHFKVAGMGRSFALGPSQQRMKDIDRGGPACSKHAVCQQATRTYVCRGGGEDGIH